MLACVENNLNGSFCLRTIFVGSFEFPFIYLYQCVNVNHSLLRVLILLKQCPRRVTRLCDVLQGQNGFEELRRYVKQGGDFCKDLSAVLQERYITLQFSI